MTCGIPSVTILGTKADWEDILCRIDRLASFGEEPGQWALRLRVIIHHFVGAFDGEHDDQFWTYICSNISGCADDSYGGWITAFCWWNPKGKRIGSFASDLARRPLVLDGVSFPIVDAMDVPAGLAEVDVTLINNGQISNCMMVAGHVASQVIGEAKDGLQPLPGWFMFVKKGGV